MTGHSKAPSAGLRSPGTRLFATAVAAAVGAATGFFGVQTLLSPGRGTIRPPVAKTTVLVATPRRPAFRPGTCQGGEVTIGTRPFHLAIALTPDGATNGVASRLTFHNLVAPHHGFSDPLASSSSHGDRVNNT